MELHVTPPSVLFASVPLEMPAAYAVPAETGSKRIASIAAPARLAEAAHVAPPSPL